MSEMIRENIARAFGAESKGSDRNAAFALQAEREGYPALGRLFRAVSDAKAVHSRRFRLLMREKIGTTAENLISAVETELRATEQLYPGMVETATKGSLAVKKAFVQSSSTDRQYGRLLKQAVEGEENLGTAYYVCQICGHISPDVLPERCPVCRAVQGRFKKVQ